MSIDITRVDLGNLLKPNLTYTLPLLIPKHTLWIVLYYTVYWFNLGNRLNMTENVLTGKITTTRTNKHSKLFNCRGYGHVRFLL